MLDLTPYNPLTHKVIGLAIEVHRNLGPGLLESAYQKCLEYELYQSGLEYRSQVSLYLDYKEIQIDCSYKLDFVISDKLILEIKSLTNLAPIHSAQLLTYMKLMEISVGLLINFNSTPLKSGIRRLVSED